LLRTWLVLAAFAARLASGQGPTYSADSITSGANFAPAPFALNSVITIFGADLAFENAQVQSNATVLPTQLGGVEVNINGFPVPLIYVSPTQINLLVPGYNNTGNAPLFVVRQGWTGPVVNIPLVAVAPQLFATSDSFVIAQHADYSQITSDAPSSPGEVIILYATGLGQEPEEYNDESNAGQLPAIPEPVNTDLQVLLNGAAIASWAAGGNTGTSNILYAGVTPGTAGVFQINLVLPSTLPANPSIQISAGGLTSSTGVILPTQPSSN
jgi:uncharacterized protein (TIGR03437 family)